MTNIPRVSERPTTTAYTPIIQYTHSSDSGRTCGSDPPPDRGERWSINDEPDFPEGDVGEADPLAEPIETSSSSADRGVSVVLPTYNECGTIRDVLKVALEELETMGYSAEAIVVDDDSPDGTGELVRKEYRDDDRVSVVIRRDDQGLAGAVLEGLRCAQARYCVVMDADGQHPPRMALNLVSRLWLGADVAVGSRHLDGGEIGSWSLGRRLTSRVASAAATLLLPSSRATSDPMSGFFALDREVVNDNVLAECDPHGYKILLELLSRAGDVDVADVPITFRERQGGESKLTLDEVVRFLEHTAGLGLEERGVSVAAPQLIRSLEFGLNTSLAIFMLMLGLITGDVDGAVGAALIGAAGSLLTFALLRLFRTDESWGDSDERYAKL